jgi:hypothetical protein
MNEFSIYKAVIAEVYGVPYNKKTALEMKVMKKKFCYSVLLYLALGIVAPLKANAVCHILRGRTIVILDSRGEIYEEVTGPRSVQTESKPYIMGSNQLLKIEGRNLYMYADDDGIRCENVLPYSNDYNPNYQNRGRRN